VSTVHLPTPIINNLTLCKKNLYWAKNGISINLVSFRTPTLDYRSDACKYGLGGYNIYAERAWRLQIPQECIGHAHINTLEFMASVILISIDIIYNNVSPNDCLLSQTDSTTAAGWLKKSNFSDSISPSESSVRLIIARKSATLIMESSTYLYSQCGLTILELPNEVHSWTLSLLRRLPNQPPSSPACRKNITYLIKMEIIPTLNRNQQLLLPQPLHSTRTTKTT
jgi:hypothetical protein